MFRGEEVGSLSRDEAADAFLKPLEGSGRTASKKLVDAVLEDVRGCPYFIQLWGAELWDEAEGAELSELEPNLLRSRLRTSTRSRTGLKEMRMSSWGALPSKVLSFESRRGNTSTRHRNSTTT
jgi:hypothetical protein